MNSERNMSRRRSLLGSISLSLLVIGGLVLCGTTAEAATVDSTLSIPVSTTFTAADGTRFTVSGKVVVKSSAVMNETDVPPFVILTFDASGLKVTSGSGSNKKTYDTRGFQVIKTRPLKATDVIKIPIPNLEIGAPLTSADRYDATFTLNFSIAGSTAGRLTSGTVTASPTAAA